MNVVLRSILILRHIWQAAISIGREGEGQVKGKMV